MRKLLRAHFPCRKCHGQGQYAVRHEDGGIEHCTCGACLGGGIEPTLLEICRTLSHPKGTET